MLLSCATGILSHLHTIKACDEILSQDTVSHFGPLWSYCSSEGPVLTVLTLYLPFRPAEQDHPGPSDIQRGSFPALSGGTLGEHHQRCRTNGWLFVHTWRPPWTHRGRVQRRSTGPSRLVERVHEQCEFPLWFYLSWCSNCNRIYDCLCTYLNAHRHTHREPRTKAADLFWRFYSNSLLLFGEMQNLKPLTTLFK